MTQTDKFSKKLSVLIADDIQETRRNAHLMFSALDNIEVIAMASNGLEAVEMVKKHRPDIVALDVNMPEMDGLTAYKHIAQIHPDTACIIISAENDSATFDAAEALGALAYLTKPFTIEELEIAVDYVVKRLNELRAKNPQPDKIRLEQLAAEYSKARRADDQAAQVFERLAEDAQCNVRWLQTLALIYAIRQEWSKLKTLSARLEWESER